MHTRNSTQQSGFSLVEMLVAVALFAIVMMVSTGALLSLIDANRKAQALHSVMNNLNIALDGMVRSIRMGDTYHCGNAGTYSNVRDCENGDTLLAFEPFGGDSGDSSDQWVYWYDANAQQIFKSEDGGSTGFAVTAPEVQIENMQFYVTGTTVADTEQPKVVIVVQGTAAPGDARTETTFNIQASATQRVLDI